MNQKLTFTAFLQDEYSKKFDQLAGRSDANIKKIEKDLLKFSRTGKQATRSIDELNKRIDVLTRVRRMTIDTRAIKFATQEIKNLQQEKARLEGIGAGSGGGMSVFGIATGIGVLYAGARLLSTTKDLVANSAQAYMNYEAIVKSFQVLAKDDKIGAALAERLNKFQQETILGPEVFRNAQTLMAFGVSVDEVEKSLQQLGAISMGNADRFQALTLAFAQTRSAGKLMGQDLLQYVNAGFNPLQTMSEKWEQFGFKSKKSIGDLRKEMEKGTISSAMVAKAFDLATGKGGQFENMLDKIGRTSFGMNQQMKGQWESFKIALGERLRPEIEGTIGGLSSLIAKAKKWIEVPVSEKIQREAFQLRVLQSELNSANLSENRRYEILQKLNADYNITLKNINDEKQAYTNLNTEINNVISSLENKAVVTRMQEGLKDIDDDITRSVNNNAKAYMRGLRAAEKMLGKEAVSEVRLDESLDLLGKLAKLNEMRKEKGIYSDEATTLSSSILYMREDQQNIMQKQTDRVEQKKILEETMSQLGMGTGHQRKGRNRGKKTTNTTGTGAGTVESAPTGTAMPSISGSSKITHLIINIDSLIKGGVNIHKATAQEGAAEMKDVVAQQLLTAVNDANLAVGK